MGRYKQAGPAIAIVISAITVALVALLILKVGAEWLADTDGLTTAAQRAEELGRARTAVLAIFAGILAVIGAYYTHKSFQLSRRGQMTDRFTRAVDQLGNTASTDVRIGGIYALESVAREAPEHHGAIMEILTTYVREHAPLLSEEEEEFLAEHTPEEFPRAPAADVQAALTVIARRTVANDPPRPWRINLRGAYLPRVVLMRADLREADLSFSVLDEAELPNAALEGTELAHARLREANLSGAHLLRANLRGAKLNGAKLNHARLRDARLREANLRRVRLADAFVQCADLTDANLHGANLMRADLQGADLLAADMEQALLSGTNLTDARLEGANLHDSRYSSTTKWPEGFDPTQTNAVRVKG